MTEPFSPMPEMPEEISRAIFGTSREERPDPFLASIAPIPNPWVKKTVGDTRLDFIDEDEGDKLLHQPLEVLDKLFTPAAPVRITPRLGELRTLPSEDPDEAEYFCPVKKLFFADLKSITPAPTQNFHKRAEDWDTPLAKRTPAPALTVKSRTLTYKQITIDDEVWNEGRDENGEVMSMMLVLDESE
jgi:hypothetical protein